MSSKVQGKALILQGKALAAPCSSTSEHVQENQGQRYRGLGSSREAVVGEIFGMEDFLPHRRSLEIRSPSHSWPRVNCETHARYASEIGRQKAVVDDGTRPSHASQNGPLTCRVPCFQVACPLSTHPRVAGRDIEVLQARATRLRLLARTSRDQQNSILIGEVIRAAEPHLPPGVGKLHRNCGNAAPQVG